MYCDATIGAVMATAPTIIAKPVAKIRFKIPSRCNYFMGGEVNPSPIVFNIDTIYCR
jgi:hypothetical protein